MGSKKTKVSDTNDQCMEVFRPFGASSSSVSNVNVRPSLSPELFMKVGTRVGVITVYYEHATQNLPCTVPSIAKPQTHIYDEPRK